MQYAGSKRRLVKFLKPIIESYLDENKVYIEPFVGGANLITEIEHNTKIGYDVNEYMIEFFNSVKNKTFYPPDFVSREEYEFTRKNQDLNKPLTAWTAVACSFGAKWFGGYAKDETKQGKSRQMTARNGFDKQIPKLADITFLCSSYEDIEVNENSVIYCDPPYKSTVKYQDIFDHDKFWDWVREKSKICTVLVSEYNAPDDFEIIWEKDVSIQMGKKNQKRTEKLFKLKGE